MEESLPYEIGIQEQRSELIHFCRHKNLTLTEIVSGEKDSPSKRTSVIHVLDFVTPGSILLVYSIHAIAHSSADLTALLYILLRRKISLYCVAEEIFGLSKISIFSLRVAIESREITNSMDSSEYSPRLKTLPSFDISSYDFSCKASFCKRDAIYRRYGKCFCKRHLPLY